MIPRLLLAGIAVLLALSCSSQNHGIYLNTNFIVTQTPVFKAGYEFQSDSSAFTFVLSVDGGRYQHSEKQLFYSSIEDYSLTGLGFMPEMRYYIFSRKSPGAYGIFTSAYLRYHRYKSVEQSGVNIVDGAYNMDQPSISTSRFNRVDAGAALGYRSPCVAGKLHLEVLGGWHPLTTEFGRESRHRPSGVEAAYRLELNLVASF